MDSHDLIKVLTFIEENIRISKQTSMEYLDPKRHIERLKSKQNQIIFGRRGSGKSLLLKSLQDNSANIVCLNINVEDFKDISFPNSIIQVLKHISKGLQDNIKQSYSFWELHKWYKSRKILKELTFLIKTLDDRLKEPDEYDQAIKSKSGTKTSDKGNLEAKALGKIESQIDKSNEIEISKQVKIDKLEILKNELTSLKELVQKISLYLEKDIFLIFDDFYFIRKNDQPYFIDFFHRLSKNTNLYLKVATIKHRSFLYTQNSSYIGIEVSHDAQELNLDYSLENFDAYIQFMKDLLQYINQKLHVEINYNDIFTDNAFRFLCLASGGVPRDFFSLFISLGNKIIEGQDKLTKPNVIEQSIQNLPNKLNMLKEDSADEKDILENYLIYLRKEIIDTKKWNAFLISNTEILNHPQINQAIKELVDLRLLHLVNSNTSSAPSDGTRYSAYMIDIGMFPNANPRSFHQIEPGQKDEAGREDKIRSAPKIHLNEFKEYIDDLHMPTILQLTSDT